MANRWIRPLRLWCGLILFVFLLCHFSNHALGLISLDAMDKSRSWLLAPWHNPIGKYALQFALLVHWLLGLWLLFRRRTLRMPRWEAMQIIFGLAIPPLLVYHVMSMQQTVLVFGFEDLYVRSVLKYWVLDQTAGLSQFALFVIAWIHGCIGLHFWLRFRPWYPKRFPIILASVVLFPVLAFLGVSQAGREVAALVNTPGFAEQFMGGSTGDPFGQLSATQSEQFAALDQRRDIVLIVVWGLLGLTLVARFIRERIGRQQQTVAVSYPDGQTVRVPKGWTLLEASRSAEIPHASVCGGRARCSTCRVRIVGDGLIQPTPMALEVGVLERIKAAPNVRLACQLRPSHDLTITPLVQVAVSAASLGKVGSGVGGGQEREMTILFADLRGFTGLAERKLPYDLVFLLNRYFEAVGGAVAQAGGIANQYTGDGVMALFGVDTEPEIACQQAIRAAGAMVARIEALSLELGGELDAPLRLGIGIHIGSVVVGEMGYAGTHYLTAVGDTVNTTSRLESLTKEYSCELIVSEEALTRAKVDSQDLPHHELVPRNREDAIRVVAVADARQFAERVNDAQLAPR